MKYKNKAIKISGYRTFKHKNNRDRSCKNIATVTMVNCCNGRLHT